MSLSISQCILICICILKVYSQNPEVEITQGRLLGDFRTNLDGGTFYSFQNIPYGKPPIGELRFRAPQPADSWEGTRDATQDLPMCVQQPTLDGQEDCLYLNVYTPNLSDNGTELPVMVWIHGGGFYLGSANEATYGPRFLLTKDIVLVAINYRVGIFGFFTLDDPNLGVTGNAGFKDQVLALQWVQNNIQHFGGDPNNVLIFGQSAGSMSVQFHLLSPMSNGLFHKAISQSGDSLTDLFQTIPRNNGVTIAEQLGIETKNWDDMLKSLQEVSTMDIAIAELEISGRSTFRFFTGPIVEISSNGTFLDRRPIDIIRTGTYSSHVPFIIGVLDAEGLTLQYLERLATGENYFIENFSEFVPYEFNVHGTPLEEILAFTIREFYYQGEQPSRDNITHAMELTTDFLFAAPSYRTVREYMGTFENPIYFYYFTAITGLNVFRSVDETIASFPGAAHGDDLGYFFSFFPSVEAGTNEDRLLRSLLDLWTNFAYYSNPTPESSNGFIWEPVGEDEFNYLHIATDDFYPMLNSVFTPERMEFWWSLYEQFS